MIQGIYHLLVPKDDKLRCSNRQVFRLVPLCLPSHLLFSKHWLKDKSKAADEVISKGTHGCGHSSGFSPDSLLIFI
jgi:hypothetical protein